MARQLLRHTTVEGMILIVGDLKLKGVHHRLLISCPVSGMSETRLPKSTANFQDFGILLRWQRGRPLTKRLRNAPNIRFKKDHLDSVRPFASRSF
jgi:hypothetical protein